MAKALDAKGSRDARTEDIAAALGAAHVVDLGQPPARGPLDLLNLRHAVSRDRERRGQR